MMELDQISAVVLAAGKSSRMGRPKMTLPWGNSTVIEHIIGTLKEAGIHHIVVVTGAAHEAVEATLHNSELADSRLVTVFNPHYQQSEMLVSLQQGIRQVSAAEECKALLVVLGDQPTIEASVVNAVAARFIAENSSIVIPSYQMRRGHPWLIARPLWGSLLRLPGDNTMRDFLRQYQNEITYVAVDTPGVLKDMDTPDDYLRLVQKKHPDKD